MPSFDDYIVYVDESGDHSLTSINPEHPVFVLAFCLFSKAGYCGEVVPSIVELKFRHFGHDEVVLHEHEIRKRSGVFEVLMKEEKRNAFLEDLNELIQRSPFTVVATAIRKQEYLDRHQQTVPDNPYHVAMGFGLERIYRHLTDLGCKGGKTWFVCEARGRREDAELELAFRRSCTRNWNNETFPFEITIANKHCNSSGLQLADLIARPIARHIIAPAQRNRAYDIIAPKLRHSPGGMISGWGLKVYP